MSFWTDKRILVTGGRGFLGSHVCELLRNLECYVFDPARALYDFTKEDATRAAFYDIKPDIVIHLAAECGGIGANQRNPGLFWGANLQMGLNVMNQAVHNKTAKLVMMGTTCAYPKLSPIPFKEEDLWTGFPEETNAPYGIAKRALMVGAEAYRKQYGLNVITLIPTNMYGPRDNFDPEDSHVIPALIRKFLHAKDVKEDVTLWGDGSPTRDFLYVLDSAQAILRAAESYAGSEPINLGSGKEVSIREIAGAIAKLCGFNGNVRWDAVRPNGQPRRVLSVQKAIQALNWQASTQLEEGLKATIEWYKSNQVRPMCK